MRLEYVDTMAGDDTDDSMSATEMSTVPTVPRFDEFFVAAHREMVRALALALGDAELGRDAASEGFCRALERWKRVSRYDNPSGWVYRVGLNWATSRRRKTRREAFDRVPELPAPSVAPVDEELVRCLRGLSVDHRSVIVGRYYLDWSEAQLAEALGVAPGTVKSRLSRALEQLTTMLETS
ncbi:MAG: sigma-70 family RNA polymerase sigma factor [Actinomycetota bacterium]